MPKKPLPHNLDAEASVLGGVILRNDLLALLDRLETDDFYDHRHKVVFEAIRNLEARREPIDVVTCENEIDKASKLEAVGGIAFLGELTLRVPTAENVVAYAEIIIGHSQSRKIALAFSEMAERAAGWEDDPDELIGEAMATVARIDRAKPNNATNIGDLVKRRVREFEGQWAAKARGETVWHGAPTGIKNLDKKVGGYPFGDVTLIAARPGMGKTAMALAAVDATTMAGFGAHVFSAEGGWRMYADRCIARASGVSVERLRNGDVSDRETEHVSHAMVKYGVRSNRWKLDDRSGLSAREIVRTVKRWKGELKTRLVVVDYLNILKRHKDLIHNENAALEDMMNAFGQEAPSDDIAWLICVQLNRENEKRPDKRPQLSDLRGSGSLEQVARLVVAPYRSSYYSDEPKRGVDYDCDCTSGMTCTHVPSPEAFQATAQVLILKNNNGQTGRVFAGWRGETTEMW